MEFIQIANRFDKSSLYELNLLTAQPDGKIGRDIASKYNLTPGEVQIIVNTSFLSGLEPLDIYEKYYKYKIQQINAHFKKTIDKINGEIDRVSGILPKPVNVSIDLVGGGCIGNPTNPANSINSVKNPIYSKLKYI